MIASEGYFKLRGKDYKESSLPRGPWCGCADGNVRRASGRGDAATAFLRALVCIAVVFVTTACGGPNGTLSNAALTAGHGMTSGYRLAPGDKIEVNVFNEPDFSGEFQVNDSGNVAFPLIGEVPAAGASIEQFRANLASRLRRGVVRNPQVSVAVSSYRPVNVLGEVRSAGQFPYRPGLTVQDAVAMAGGYTYRANTRTVYIRRAAANGEVEVRTDGKPVAIKAGDTVRVPQRFF